MTAAESKKCLIAACGLACGNEKTAAMLIDMYALETIRLPDIYTICKDPMLYEILSRSAENSPGVFAQAVSDYLRINCELNMPICSAAPWNQEQSQALFNTLIPDIVRKLGRFYD